jgi:alkylhydroperoxidase family enzyme
VAETHAPDEVYDAVRAQFDDKELIDLTLMIASMNAWNRMSIGFRRQRQRREK